MTVDAETARLNLCFQIARTGTTEAELARRVGCSTHTVNHHVSGRTPIPARRLDEYAAAFGVDVSTFSDTPPLVVVPLAELVNLMREGDNS